MDGLQDLNIALTKGPHWLLDDPDIDGLARLLRPLMMVQQVSSFNVILYWPRPVDMNELQ
ncbi:hypothetical protein N7456_004749 [Penicillium angulare]|uniref:Uncharacterized protein n=1 Tax=Penicillium angulare TaxID=116970 RepID=A0A9W9KIN6_9EURO|nr:hypothetical protein N7456_004749 [Penicillium angulare]